MTADGSKLVADWSFAPALIGEDEVARSGAELVPRAGSAGASCGAARRRWAHAVRSAAGRALAGGDRAAGEPVSAASRTCCRCRRCRKACCSTRFMMRRRRTSIRCSWSSISRVRSRAARWKPRRRRCWRVTPACGPASAHQELSRPVQVIVAQAAAPWRHGRSVFVGRGGAPGGAARVAAQDRAARFDLAAPPLMRFALIRLAADRHRLVLTNHHLLMDGWSAPVLVRELFAALCERGAMPRRCRA